MPKEIINDARQGTKHDSFTTHFAKVGWDRELGLVDIATLEGGDVDEPTRARKGYFVQLDRDGVNQLIRTLRRARDAAYGSDA